MPGGLGHLVAYGAQDVCLTGNPQITFFKVVYRRHTNLSMSGPDETLSYKYGTMQQTDNQWHASRLDPVVCARLRRFCKGIRNNRVVSAMQEPVRIIGRTRIISAELVHVVAMRQN